MKKIIKFGDIDNGALEQAERCLEEAEAFALMADNHKGYGMPVGGVAVYKDKISPAGVGFDIACGNKAVKINVRYEDIKHRLPQIADIIWDTFSFGVGQKNDIKVEWKGFYSDMWDIDFFNENPEIRETAMSQLGTIGSGNHYIDVFKDEDGYIWVGVHFGSRGLGHKIASHFMKLAGDNVNIMDETPHTLDVNTKDGAEYMGAMFVAGEYAYAGRNWVCAKVAQIIGGDIIEEVHNHHNYAWKEKHNGEEYYVVRKGATPAFPEQKGFIGGSMGDNAVIVKGVDSEKSREAFYSTIHGAGRVMSRTQAVGKTKWIGGKKVNMGGGLVDMDSVREEIKNKGIILKGAGGDEAPQVYKKLPEVLKAHEGTIEILNTLTPLIVCMAGEDTFDPFKD
jgi:tRNA-splicing ligase RtcB